MDNSTQLVPTKSGLFWRAVLAFLALPTMVALIVPWLLLPDTWQFHVAAIPALVVGTVLLLWCVRDFYVAGRGTLAPWSPPKHLVTVGLYRYSRNPMYVAVAAMLFGWALAFASPGLAVYGALVCVAFHLRVVFGEEPWLARTHGAAWDEYRARVPRWLM